MMEKETSPIVHMGQGLLHAGYPLEIQHIRTLEAQQVLVEMDRLFHVVGVKPEVAQPPNLEGLVQHHPANVELLLGGRHSVAPFAFCSYGQYSQSYLSARSTVKLKP